MFSHQVALQHRHLLTAFKTHDVVGEYRLRYGHCWLVRFGRSRFGFADCRKRLIDFTNKRRKFLNRNGVLRQVRAYDLGGEIQHFIRHIFLPVTQADSV
jgi:hypothetical protein